MTPRPPLAYFSLNVWLSRRLFTRNSQKQVQLWWWQQDLLVSWVGQNRCWCQVMLWRAVYINCECESPKIKFRLTVWRILSLCNIDSTCIIIIRYLYIHGNLVFYMNLKIAFLHQIYISLKQPRSQKVDMYFKGNMKHIQTSLPENHLYTSLYVASFCAEEFILIGFYRKCVVPSDLVWWHQCLSAHLHVHASSLSLPVDHVTTWLTVKPPIGSWWHHISAAACRLLEQLHSPCA